MPKPTTRRPRPYAFVFQLGTQARAAKKRVPGGLMSSLGFFYRSDHEPLAAKLDAIAEHEVTDADAELAFSAVDATVERHELVEQLYTDAELLADGKHEEKAGFHAGGTFSACREALERGGFVVEDVPDLPRSPASKTSTSQALDLLFRQLERHLDLTSPSIVLDALSGDAELPLHAGSAADLLARASDAGDAAALAKRVAAASPRWHAEIRDSLMVLAASAARDGKGGAKAFRALVASLQPPTDPAVAAKLAEWRLLPVSAEPAARETASRRRRPSR